jgi:hypothetical protein
LGEFKIFLPHSPVEANICIAEAETVEGQPVVTVKEMEKTLMFSQEKGNEHSEEWLNIFSQEDEKETVAALKLTTRKEEENVDKMLTPWEKELEMLEDWLRNPEPVNDCHE